MIKHYSGKTENQIVENRTATDATTADQEKNSNNNSSIKPAATADRSAFSRLRSVSTFLSNLKRDTEMPAKVPMYLKNSHGGKQKKLREILSADMISMPINGEFKHTAHVGRGDGDMFGDTTFLTSNQSPVSQSSSTSGGAAGGGDNMGSTASSERSLDSETMHTPAGGVATLRRNGQFWKPGKKTRNSRKSVQSMSALSSNTSDKDRNSSSAPIGAGDRKSSASCDDVMAVTSQQQQTPVAAARKVVQQQPPTVQPSPCRTNNGDNLSVFEGWTTDLGTSMLDDILKVMDHGQEL